MKLTNVKGLVWDFDGTLLDSFSIFEGDIKAIALEKGLEIPSHKDIVRNYHGSLEEVFQQILGIDSAKELNVIVSNFIEKQKDHYSANLDSHLFQDALMLAQEAAKLNIHQLVVTNRNHRDNGVASPKIIIAETVLADCIHEVHAGDDVEFRKPDRRSLGDWLERKKLDGHEVIVIGDQFVDAQLAINIGARAVLINRLGNIPHIEQLVASHPKDIIIVDSLDDIKFS